MPKRPNHLRHFCRRAGITQRELAHKLGVSPEWVSRIAHGKALFSEYTERRIVRILNLTSDEANQAFHYPGPHLFAGKESEPGSRVIEFPGSERTDI